MFVLRTLVVFILESENWQWFPRLHATIHHDWSRAVMYPERGRIAEMHHDRDTFEFIVKAMWPGIKNRQSLFS